MVDPEFATEWDAAEQWVRFRSELRVLLVGEPVTDEVARPTRSQFEPHP
jgi:hypothetical protein